MTGKEFKSLWEKMGREFTSFELKLDSRQYAHISYVKRAKEKKGQSLRYSLDYIFVYDGRAYCTDGKALHWCDTDIPDGMYDIKNRVIIRMHPHELLRYPNIFSITDPNLALCCNSTKIYTCRDIDSIGKQTFDICRTVEKGTYDADYILNALCEGIVSDVYEVTHYFNTSGIDDSHYLCVNGDGWGAILCQIVPPK